MNSSLTRLIAAFPRYVLLGALCAAVLVAVSPVVAADLARAAYSGGKFLFLVDGETVGYARKISGGTIKAEVVTHTDVAENIVKKHIGAIKHEPFEIEIGMGTGRAIFDWISQSLEMDFERRSGEIIALDSQYRAMASREFSDALITELSFPAFDASSKEPAHLTVEFAPEGIVYKKGDGSTVGSIDSKANAVLCSNFSVDLPGLPTERVLKVDSFTIKQLVTEVEPGKARQASPTSLELPNLKLTISMADIEPWQEWFEDFVVRGHCSDADELEGAIQLLAPDLKEELCRIDLSGVGIVSLETDAAEANQEQTARFTVELYVESMAFGRTAKE